MRTTVWQCDRCGTEVKQPSMPGDWAEITVKIRDEEEEKLFCTTCVDVLNTLPKIDKVKIAESSLDTDNGAFEHRTTKRSSQSYWSPTLFTTLGKFFNDSAENPVFSFHNEDSSVIFTMKRSDMKDLLLKSGKKRVMLPGVKFIEKRQAIARIRAKFPFIHSDSFHLCSSAGDGTPHVRFWEDDFQ
jgi:hypothetical protein